MQQIYVFAQLLMLLLGCLVSFLNRYIPSTTLRPYRLHKQWQHFASIQISHVRNYNERQCEVYIGMCEQGVEGEVAGKTSAFVCVHVRMPVCVRIVCADGAVYWTGRYHLDL